MDYSDSAYFSRFAIDPDEDLIGQDFTEDMALIDSVMRIDPDYNLTDDLNHDNI